MAEKKKQTFAGFLPYNPSFFLPGRKGRYYFAPLLLLYGPFQKRKQVALTATLTPTSLSFSFSPCTYACLPSVSCFAAAREFQTFLAGIGQRHADELFPRAIHHTGVAIQKRNQTD